MRELPEKIQNAVIEAFDLEGLWARSHAPERDAEGHRINSLMVDYLWIVQSRLSLAQTVTLAGIRATPWREYDSWQRKGLLLIPPTFPLKEKDFTGVKPLRTIDLVDDPVAETLQSVSVLPHGLGVVDDYPSPDFTLYSFTIKGEVSFDYRGYPESQSIETLWQVLKDTFFKYVELYDDVEINEFVRTCPRRYSGG